MDRKTIFAALLMMAASLAGFGGETVSFAVYTNSRYGYRVEYPSELLIPQGEADNGDGQKFISSDGSRQLWVYRAAKMNIETGDPPSLEEAFADDMSGKRITDKKLSPDRYYIAGKTGKRIFRQYTFLRGDNFFTLYFEYPEKDAALFVLIAERVAVSFSFEKIAAPLPETALPALEAFLRDCYWNKNCNALLRDNAPELRRYIDPAMDVRRYYNPGAATILFSRKQNFGFDTATDFTTRMKKSDFGRELRCINREPDDGFCEQSSDKDGLYYYAVEKLPDSINTETFEAIPVAIPYPDAAICKAVLLYKGWILKSFYFVETPAGWRLVCVDDSDCSA